MLRRSIHSLILLLLLPAVAFAAGRAVLLVDAARNGDLTAVRALVQQGANVNDVEPDGTTALHWAAHRGDLAAVDLLLRAGARQVPNHYGVTPLALAAENGTAPV